MSTTETAHSAGPLERLVRPRTRSRRIVECVVLAVWLVAVGLQVSHHVMFRDEVRALTLALSGNSIWAMLRTIHGEGHPAIWYLLLRVAHQVFGSVTVLPGLALLVAIAAVALLLFRSPFPLILVVLIMASDAFAYEYSVMARNYGISALLLFVIAANYQAWRKRGYLIGGLLFLLANQCHCRHHDRRLPALLVPGPARRARYALVAVIDQLLRQCGDRDGRTGGLRHHHPADVQ
ncbi:hypothetical protein [Rhizobium ruizarguesonis]|uniref:hypothetical protein n=1 Tax=Rhizobium ruizarguesonis TaxID=2081791 RepID=UPI001FEFB73A|nr:hypothetical protein [Rhizobium ruizarguesonis]